MRRRLVRGVYFSAGSSHRWKRGPTRATCGRLKRRVFVNNGDARAEIMRSIRSHLAASVRYDGRANGIDKDLRVGNLPCDPCKSPFPAASRSVVEEFKRNLEAVDGHCVIARDN